MKKLNTSDSGFKLQLRMTGSKLAPTQAYDYSLLSMEKPRDTIDVKQFEQRDGERSPRKFMESFLHKIAEIKRINRGGDEVSVVY